MTMRDRCRAALVLVLIATLLALSPSLHAQSSADTAAARELFFEGVSLAKLGQWNDAVDRYQRSLALKHSAVTVYSLGVAQKNAGKLVDALESFRAFLRDEDAEAVARYKGPAEQAIAELDRRVARVTLTVAPPATGLTVSLDGANVPIAALGRPRLVDPGAHELVARAEGHRDGRQGFSIGEGEESAVAITLEPLPVTTQPERPVPAPQEADGPPILPIALMSGGAVLLGVGIGVGVAGVSEASDAPSSDGDEASSARTKAAVGDTLAAVGIAALAVGTVLLVVDLVGDDEPTAQSWRRRAEGHVLEW